MGIACTQPWPKRKRESEREGGAQGINSHLNDHGKTPYQEDDEKSFLKKNLLINMFVPAK